MLLTEQRLFAHDLGGHLAGLYKLKAEFGDGVLAEYADALLTYPCEPGLPFTHSGLCYWVQRNHKPGGVVWDTHTPYVIWEHMSELGLVQDFDFDMGWHTDRYSAAQAIGAALKEAAGWLTPGSTREGDYGRVAAVLGQFGERAEDYAVALRTYPQEPSTVPEFGLCNWAAAHGAGDVAYDAWGRLNDAGLVPHSLCEGEGGWTPLRAQLAAHLAAII
jgi:hypothetical protein